MNVLVHLHVYYLDQVPYFLEKLSCVGGCQWDLVVTSSSLPPREESLLREFKPDVRFIQAENVGYDVWPFMKVLSSVDLDAYDVILKLHTKHSTENHKVRINGVHMKGFMWRDILVDALLGSPEQFSRVLEIFRSHPDAGMVCSGKLYCALGFAEDHKLLDDELSRLGLETPERRFCVGTMFAIRPSLLKVIVRQGFTAADFPSQTASNAGGTPAHVYERVFSLLAPAQGMKVYTTGVDKAFERKQRIRRVVKPLLGFLFNIDREGENSAKYLTVFGLKFKLDDGDR